MSAQSCVNCHFFAVRHFPDPPGSGHTYDSDVGRSRRKQAKAGDFTWVRKDEALFCHKMVWYGSAVPYGKEYEELVRRDRTGFCFYLEFHEDMSFPTGEELERRTTELREASRDRRLTTWGLWIAAIALLASTIVGILELLKGLH